MLETASKVYRCWRCNKRLNIDDVQGSVLVICRPCRAENRISS